MSPDRFQLTGRKRRLPDIAMVAANDATDRLLRPRRALVIFALHDPDCAACRGYIESLQAAQAELASWDADVAVITPRAMTSPTSLRLFLDSEGRFTADANITAPAVVIVDQWGDIKEVNAVGGTHDFPKIEGLLAWIRFLATQCPECEGESL